MNCPNCNTNMPDEAKFCPSCGWKVEANRKKTIEIHGYKEWYLYSPPIRVFINDILCAEVNHNEIKKVNIDRKDCIITFKWGLVRPFILNVPAEFEGKILIETSRWTGQHSAILANL